MTAIESTAWFDGPGGSGYGEMYRNIIDYNNYDPEFYSPNTHLVESTASYAGMIRLRHEFWVDTAPQWSIFFLNFYSYDGDSIIGWMFDVFSVPYDHIIPAVSIDGFSGTSGSIVRPLGQSVPVTVRFKATASAGSFIMIRPVTKRPSMPDDRRTTDYEYLPGTSGEVVRTIVLNQNGVYRFSSDAASEQMENNGQYSLATSPTDYYTEHSHFTAGFTLSVTEASYSPPSLTIQYLDSNGNILTPQGDGNIHVQTGSSIRIRFIATSPGGDLGRLYWRVQKPGNAQGASLGGQWGWGGWGWGGEMAVSGDTTWTMDPITLNAPGLWNFWHHAQAATAGPITGDGNINGWATLEGPDILVDSGRLRWRL
ncbi:MAG: hypothetical protein QM760_14810 [Nibricoccus sp.]